MDLIRLVYNYTDSEIVWLIIKEDPDSWSSLLQPNLCKSVVQFQNTVKYHESTLLAMSQPPTNMVTQFPNRAFQSQKFCSRKAHVNMVGWTPNLEPPKFFKDDKNISSRKTPESVNAGPCRHCRSGKHWDYKCKYSRKGERQAQANFILLLDPDVEALSAYDNLYYELDSENESVNDSQDFHEPLQSSDQHLQIKSEDESRLEGNQEKVTASTPESSETFHAVTQKPVLHLG